MSSRRYVLDTSAVVALMEDEGGADEVELLLEAEGAVVLPFAVLLEVYYVSRREKGELLAERRYLMMRELGAEIIWGMDEATLLTAGRLKASYRLSLADAVIAACAIRRNATLVHKDPEYEALASEVSLETLPYKTASRG